MRNFILYFGIIQSLACYVQADDQVCLENVKGSLLPHPTNLNWYIECRDGIPNIEICPAANVFNARIQACISERVDKEIKEELATTTNGPRTTEHIETSTMYFTTSTKETADTEDSTDHTNTANTYSTIRISTTYPATIYIPTRETTIPQPLSSPEISVDILEENIMCPCRDTDRPTYFASRQFCGKYYLCYRSRPLEMSCCRGYHWDQRRHTCIPEYQSQCGAIQPVQASQVPDCPAQGCAFYPHPTVCEYFYYCENGVKSMQQCEAFYEWDFYAQKCLIKSQARCITSIPAHMRTQFYV